VDGQPLAGRQMVAVLNAVHLNFATLGNHEFDVSEDAFHHAMAVSNFTIVISNVTDINGKQFEHTVPSMVTHVRAGGRDLRIGLIGLVVDETVTAWARYLPAIESAKAQVEKLRGQVDAIVALTHLTVAEDRELVIAVPEIDLVLGGHEHENWMLQRGAHLTPIIKADANVRTVAIVTMAFGAAGTRPAITARLQEIDERITPNPSVDDEVKRWTTIAFDAFSKDGFIPEAVVANVTAPLDGREGVVRHDPGLLTDIITSAFAHEVPGAQVAILNSGSIRIDDVLPPGPIRQYDIIRVLPFGGTLSRATFDGALLARVLDAGLTNAGSGGYLQTWGARKVSGRWLIQDQPIDPSARYLVAFMDYLLTGGEQNLGFLTRTNPQVHDVSDGRDVRQIVIDELKRRYPR
jgi:5'-nucleotidase